MATYPSGVKTFTSKSAGQSVSASHVNDLQDEVIAIEDGLLNGTAPIVSSRATVASLQVSGHSTVVGSLTVSSNCTVAGRLTARIIPRVTQVTTSSALTPNADTDDLYDITALASNSTFALPSGTAVNGQKLIIRIKDNGTSRSLTWSTSYVSGGSSLASATSSGKYTTLGFLYNGNSSRWYCVANVTEQ